MTLSTSLPKAGLFEPLNRSELLKCLGLESFSYLFIEAMDDIVLRALRVHGEKSERLLDPWSLDRRVVEGLTSPQLPAFVVRRTGYRLGVDCIERERSLVEEALPYPLNQMIEHSRSEDVASLMVIPKGLVWSLRRFGSALSEIEKALARYEIGCLALRGECGNIALLTHQFGRRRVKLGVLRSLTGELDVESLANVVGTAVGVIRVTAERQPNLIGQLEHLTLAFATGLSELVQPAESRVTDAVRPELTL